MFQDVKVRRANLEALDALDISALRALAEQHAAQLREVAADNFDLEDGQPLVAAADFLCAPRRGDAT